MPAPVTFPELSGSPLYSSALWLHELPPHKGWLRTHSVPGAVLGTGNLARSKVDKNPYSHGVYF